MPICTCMWVHLVVALPKRQELQRCWKIDDACYMGLKVHHNAEHIRRYNRDAGSTAALPTCITGVILHRTDHTGPLDIKARRCTPVSVTCVSICALVTVQCILTWCQSTASTSTAPNMSCPSTIKKQAALTCARLKRSSILARAASCASRELLLWRSECHAMAHPWNAA